MIDRRGVRCGALFACRNEIVFKLWTVPFLHCLLEWHGRSLLRNRAHWKTRDAIKFKTNHTRQRYVLGQPIQQTAE
jgi:hypothetical protein